MNKLFLIIVIFHTLSVKAWDGKRQGFLLGLGFGPGTIEYKNIESASLKSNERSKETNTFNFIPKIGYAFTNQFALLLFQHN